MTLKLKLMFNKGRVIVLLVTLLMVTIIYLCFDRYPYRGGINRMRSYFGDVFIIPMSLVNISLANGSFWDDPRFRFRINPKDFEVFTEKIKASGYSQWVEKGGSYGSFNEESKVEDPLLYSFKNNGRLKLMFFYRPSTSTIDAVTFYN